MKTCTITINGKRITDRKQKVMLLVIVSIVMATVLIPMLALAFGLTYVVFLIGGICFLAALLLSIGFMLLGTASSIAMMILHPFFRLFGRRGFLSIDKSQTGEVSYSFKSSGALKRIRP